MKRLRRLLHLLLVTINICLALALTASYLSVYINPADFWIPALFGLVTPLLLALNLLFIIYWLIRWKRTVFISLIAMLIGLPQMVNYFRFRTPQPPFNGPRDFTILSYNVNLFRLYAWAETPPTTHDIAHLVKTTRADIICLQEFYTHDSLFPEAHARLLFGDNAHVHYVSEGGNSHYGIATFSRFPIVDKGEIHFDNSMNTTIFSDIQIGSDTIRIYNNHLQSFRFSNRDLAFIRNPSLKANDKPLHNLLGVMKRMRTALKKRAVQVETVRNHIDASPYPVVVCGDFNDSPISYTYKRMKGPLQDAFTNVGDGFGSTYQNIFPSFRIDYVLYSKQLNALDLDIPNVYHSDHFPVVVPMEIVDSHSTETPPTSSR